MRPIKFRVWDKDLGIMFNDVSVLYQEAGIYMQYTGLTDKNGKEIYEGDVLTNNLYKNHNVAFKCYYEDKEAMYRLLPFKLKIDGKPIGTKDLSLQMDSVRRKEIIGNVFEDKHLLEATK